MHHSIFLAPNLPTAIFSRGTRLNTWPFLSFCPFSVGIRQKLGSRLFSSGWINQTSTSALLAMFWLGIAASNSVERKTARNGTCNLTSSKLHRHTIMKNVVMVVNIRVPRLMRPGRDFFTNINQTSDFKGERPFFPRAQFSNSKQSRKNLQIWISN